MPLSWPYKKWAGCMGLHPVTVYTDHQSLQSWHKKHAGNSSGTTSRRARWHKTVTKFGLRVVYGGMFARRARRPTFVLSILSVAPSVSTLWQVP